MPAKAKRSATAIVCAMIVVATMQTASPASGTTTKLASGTAPSVGNPVPLSEWTRVPRTWPTPVTGGEIAYDAARGEILSFGGCCYNGETWTFKDGNWTQHELTVSPDPRSGHAMSYDPLRQEVVMFGGTDQGDTWIWDGAEWGLHMQPDGPQFRSNASLAWMPAIERVVMFGGHPDADPNELGTNLEDTWTWNGQRWARVDTPTGPPSRYGAGMAADPETGNLVLFGGLSDEYESLDDTWIFDGTTWTEFEGEITPPARSLTALATNPTLGVAELFSGYVIERGPRPLADRWFFTGEEWTQTLPGIETGPLPPGRHGAGFVHDPTAGTMVVYGGHFCEPSCGGFWTERLQETQLPDGTIERRLIWDHLASPWPPDRMSAGTMVADPLGRGTVLFGGMGDWAAYGENIGDTWFWREGTWSSLQDADGITPPSLQRHSIAVHRNSETVVLFGGTIERRAFDPRTWVLDRDGWDSPTPGRAPPVRHSAGMAEDRNGNVVLFGGTGTNGVLGDTWIWDGESWTEHSGPGPTARSGPHMSYDPVRQETVLFGGSDAAVPSSETWVWDGEGWSRRTPLVSPQGRFGAAMAWDPASERTMLYGGGACASLACLVSSDVWSWDGITWSPEISLPGGPGARWFVQAGPDQDGIVLFGGHDGSSTGRFADTWLWRAEDIPVSSS